MSVEQGAVNNTHRKQTEDPEIWHGLSQEERRYYHDLLLDGIDRALQIGIPASKVYRAITEPLQTEDNLTVNSS